MTTCNAIIIRCPNCASGYHYTPVHPSVCLEDPNPHYPRPWPAHGRCKCGAPLPVPGLDWFAGTAGTDLAGLQADVRRSAEVTLAAAGDPARSERGSRSVRRMADRLDRMAEQLAAGVIDYSDLDLLADNAGDALGCDPGDPGDGTLGWIPPTPEIAAQLQAASDIVAAIRALELPAAPRLAGDGRLADVDDFGRLVKVAVDGDVDPEDPEVLGPEPWWRRHFAGGRTAPEYARVDVTGQAHHVTAVGFSLWEASGPGYYLRRHTMLAAMVAGDAMIAEADGR